MPFCKCGNFYVKKEEDRCDICVLQERIVTLILVVEDIKRLDNLYLIRERIKQWEEGK